MKEANGEAICVQKVVTYLPVLGRIHEKFRVYFLRWRWKHFQVCGFLETSQLSIANDFVGSFLPVNEIKNKLFMVDEVG